MKKFTTKQMAIGFGIFIGIMIATSIFKEVTTPSWERVVEEGMSKKTIEQAPKQRINYALSKAQRKAQRDEQELEEIISRPTDTATAARQRLQEPTDKFIKAWSKALQSGQKDESYYERQQLQEERNDQIMMHHWSN